MRNVKPNFLGRGVGEGGGGGGGGKKKIGKYFKLSSADIFYPGCIALIN